MPSRLDSPAAESGTPPEKFEELLARLEQIVSAMENGDLPLDKLLSSYEEGMHLVKSCGDRLTDAEQKVEILSRAAELPKPSAAVETIDPLSRAEPEEDIRLF